MHSSQGILNNESQLVCTSFTEVLSINVFAITFANLIDISSGNVLENKYKGFMN